MAEHRSWLIAACVVILLLGTCERAVADRDWSLVAYGAVILDGNLSDASLLSSGYEDSYFGVLGLAKRIASYREMVAFEAEGQAARHFIGQDHWEFNGLITVRWLPFPFDQYLDASVAAGSGLSYATKTPRREEELRGEGQTAQLLFYLMLELTLSLPRFPNWALITRLHHRSGAFGLFDGVTGASNAWGIGLKYSF